MRYRLAERRPVGRAIPIAVAGLTTLASVACDDDAPLPTATRPPAAATPAPTPEPTPTPSPEPATNVPPSATFKLTPAPGPHGVSLPVGGSLRVNMCPSSDPDVGDTLVFRVDWGDGMQTRGPCRQEHAYPMADVYTLVAEVSDGHLEDQARATATQTLSVTVLVGGLMIESFTASPAAITPGESATLAWKTTAATQCVIDQGVGEVPCAGETKVSPAVDTTYSLTASAPGRLRTAVTTVTVTPATGSTTFSSIGQHTFTVPPLVTEVTVEACGAQGGEGSSGFGVSGGAGDGGLGGCVGATIDVTPGESLAVFVGGRGDDGIAAQPTTSSFNGGASTPGGGGGGGGASDVRQGGDGLEHRVVVAGGGGGGGAGFAPGANGGDGGGVVAEDGEDADGSGGGGGTDVSGGAGGADPLGAFDGLPGDSGTGGAGGQHITGGGGGGGGYYGGGGGGGAASGAFPASGGGGGGSSYADPGATGVTHQQGVHSGDGEVAISW